MASTNDSQGSTSVWYFIAAVFVFALPNLLFTDVHVGIRVAILVAGIALMAVGFLNLRREVVAKNQPADDDGSGPQEE